MKKNSILILLFGLFFSFVRAATLGDVSVSFCNSGFQNRLDVVAQDGNSYPICVYIESFFKEPIELSIGFVDAAITSDAMAKKACLSNGNSIVPYLDFDHSVVTILPQEKLFLTGNLTYPIGYSGNINACLVYSLLEKNSESFKKDSLFNVLVRKAYFIEGQVVGNFSRNLILDKSNVISYQDNNDYIIQIPFYNSGVLNEVLSFSGTLKNSLGYERTFESSVVLNYGTSSLVNFRFQGLPFYKGKYLFSFSAISSLDDSVSLSYLSNDVKKPLFFEYENAMFIFPWKLFLYVGGIIFLIYFFRKLVQFLRR